MANAFQYLNGISFCKFGVNLKGYVYSNDSVFAKAF